MKKEVKQKLTLDQPATYQIIVPGYLNRRWAEGDGRMTIEPKSVGDGPPLTTLTGTIDQAALQGLLRRLYSLGLPLISVIWIKEE